MKTDTMTSEEIKPGYKRTEVGIIPEDWNACPIRDIADIKTGPFGSALHEKDYVQDGTPIITVEHLTENGVSHSGLPMVSDIDKKRLSNYQLKENDIVFSRVGAIDRNSLIRACEEGWLFSGRLLRIRPEHNNVFAPYLSHHFHTKAFKERVRSVAVGQTMPSLNTQILNGIVVVLPSLGEQRAIAEALSDVDALLEALDRLIAKKRDIKQGAMQALLTGRVRLPGFTCKPGYKRTEVGVIPEDWDVDTISSLASITTGARNTQDNVDNGEYPFFVRSAKVERINSYSYDGEAVLTAGDGVGTGKIYHYINGKFDFHQRVYKISDFSCRLDGYYFYLYFSSNFYNRIVSMTAKSSVDSVRMEMIANMQIPQPPLHEQHAIAEVLSDMDAEIEALEQRRAKLRALKQGMMQELLTGRTRLVQPGQPTQEVIL